MNWSPRSTSPIRRPGQFRHPGDAEQRPARARARRCSRSRPSRTPHHRRRPTLLSGHGTRFTSNGGIDVVASRLYMYGGAGADWQAVPADLWYFGSYVDKWTLVTPSSTVNPDRRQWTGLSCGAGTCVMATGSNGFGLVDETWVYNEATNLWTKAACGRRAPCPSPRQMTTMAFDPERGNHLLFGGIGSTAGLDDTQTFDPMTLKWTLRAPALKPSERNRAAAVHVPGNWRCDARRTARAGRDGLLRHVCVERLELDAHRVRCWPVTSLSAHAQHGLGWPGSRRDRRPTWTPTTRRVRRTGALCSRLTVGRECGRRQQPAPAGRSTERIRKSTRERGWLMTINR